MNYRHSIVLVFTLIVTGCGPKPSLEKIYTLELDVTPRAELRELFGKPERSDSYEEEGHSSSVEYWYGHTFQNIGPVAWMNYYWLAVETENDKTTGYLYLCNHGKNETAFDFTLGDQIKIGMTESEVLRILGPSNGMALNKTEIEAIKRASGPNVARLLAWSHASKVQGVFVLDAVSVKTFIVKIDSDGKVIGTGTYTEGINF